MAEAHELGNVDLYANTTHSLADLSLDRGAWDEATERYLESLAIFEDIKRRTGVAYCLAGVAAVAAGRKNAVRAGRLWGATIQMEQDLGNPLLAFERRRYEKLVDRVRGPQFDAAVAQGRALEMAAALKVARNDR